MKLQLLFASLLAATTFTAAAQVRTTQTASFQGPDAKQTPIQLSAAQSDKVVAVSNGRGGGGYCGNVPRRDGNGNQYGRKKGLASSGTRPTCPRGRCLR